MAKKDDDLDVLLPNWSGAAAHGFSISGNDDGIFIKDVVQNSPVGKSGVMKEGDQIVSATIYFDEMGYEEAQKILQTVDRHTVGLKLHRKGEKLSPGGSYSWDPERLGATSPDAVLSGDDEDYQRIYRTKIKPRLKSEDGIEASDQGDRSSSVHITRKVITRTVHTSSPTVTTDMDIQNPEFKIKVPRYEQVTIERSGPKLEKSEMDVDVNLSGAEGRKFQMGDGQRTTQTMHIVKTKVVEVSGPDTEHGQATFHMPQINLSGATVQTSDLDVKLAKTNVDISSPNVDLAASNVKFPDASIDVSAPEVTTDMQIPVIDTRTTRLDVDIQGTGGKIKMPSIKMPEFSISGSKVRGPVVDINTSAPKTDISGPKIDANFNVSGNHDDLKGPKIDAQTSKIHIDGSAFNTQDGKLNIKMKTRNYNISGSNAKEIPDAQVTNKWTKVERPDLNIDAKFPKADDKLSGPKIEGGVEMPDIDVEEGYGQLKGPKFTMPGFKISGPKIQKPDFDLEFKGPKVAGDVDTPDINLEGEIKGPNWNITGPKVDLEGRDGKGSGFKFSKPSIQMPQIKAPDLDLSLKGPNLKGDHDIDIRAPNIQGEIKGPKVDIDVDVPEAEIEGGNGRFHLPKFKMPKFRMGEPKAEGPDLNIDAKPSKADVKVSGPKIEGGIEMPDVDVDVEGSSGKIKGPKFKMPEFNISGPKIQKPDFDLEFKGPELAGDVEVPDINLEGDMKGPNLNIKGRKVDLEGPDAKGRGIKFSMPSLQMPHIKAPDFDLSLKGPKLKGDHDIDLSSPSIEGGIKGPKVDIDVDVPEAEIEGGIGKFHLPKFKMPKFQMSGPKVEGPDLNIDAKLPEADVKLSAPKIEGGVEMPNVDLDVEGSSGKIKGAKFKMPEFNISGPKIQKPDFDLEFKGPKVAGDVNAPDINLEGDMKGPNLNIKGPKVDLEGPDAKGRGLKFSMPSLQMPHVKGPDLDLTLKGPKLKGDHDIDLSSPNIDGRIKGPKVDIDVDVPEAEIEGGSGKFHLPKFKMPKFQMSGPKVEGPDLNIDAKLPEADVKLSGPKIEGGVEMPDVDVDVEGSSGKIKGPKFKMPEFNISGPKIQKPDFDLEFKGPKVAGDVDAPDINLDGDMKGPNLNIKGPKVDLERPEAKGRGLKFSMPSLQMPHIKAPDFDLSLKGPKLKGDHDIDLSSPNIDGGIKGPKVDIDVDMPEAEIDGGSGKFHLPKFKMPKFQMSGPKVEGPDLNIDAKLPEADVKLSGPKIEGGVEMPDVDVDVEGSSGKIKGPKFKMPEFNISGPKIQKPDFDLEFKGPKVAGDVDAPDINLDGDMKGPNLNIKGPKVDLERSEAKGRGLKFSMPSLQMPHIKAPDFDLSLKGPKLKGDHDIDLSSPNIDGGIKGPKVDIDVDMPEAEIDGGSGKFHLPKFKMPKFQMSGPKVEGPDLNIDAKLPEADVKLSAPKIEGGVEMPDVDVDMEGSSGKIKGPKFKMPEFNISGPKIQKPDFDLEFKGPKVAGDVDVPDINLEGDMKGPNLNIKGPKVDPEGPEAKGRGLKFSMPSLQMPHIKAPDFDLSLKGPKLKGDHDIDLSSPNIEGGIKGPKGDIDVDVPEAEIEGGSGKFHLPKFKMPKFQMGGPKVEGPDLNIDATFPEADVKLSGPKIEGGVEMPDVDLDVEGPSGKIKGPKFKMPGFISSGPKIQKPDFDLEFKGPKVAGDVDAPDINLEGDMKGPNLNIKGPKVGIEGPEAKGSGLKFSMPSLQMPHIKAPDIDLSLKGPKLKGDHDIDLPAPNIQGEIKGPKVDIDVDVPEAEIEGGSGRFHLPKFKMPKFQIGGPKVEGPDLNIDAKLPEADVKLSGPKIEGGVEMPDVDVDVEGSSGKIKGPKFKMPEFNISGPKIQKPDFDLEFKGPKVAGDVDTPNINLEGDMKGPNLNIKGPKMDLEGPDGKGSGFKFSMPSLQMPQIKAPGLDLNLKGPKLKGDHDIDLPAPNIQGEIKGPKVDIDVDVPEAEIEGGSGRFHLPKFKMPKFRMGGPKVEGPDLNIDANLPEADVKLSGPKIEGGVEMPDVDLDVEGPSGKIKGPKFKMPEFNISGPKIQKPDFDLEFKGPKVAGDVNAPDITLEGGMKGPNLNIKGPKVDLEGPDGKGSGLKFSMPSIGLPHIKAPDFDLNLKGPKLKGDHDIDLSSPSIEGGIKGPKVDIDVDVPEAEIEGGNGRFHLPKFKMPKFRMGGPKVEGPDLNIDANLPEADVKLSGPKIEGGVEMPDVDLDVEGPSGKIKGPKFKMPEFNISGPKIQKPDFDLKFKSPKVAGDVDAPDINLEGGMKGPNLNIKGPKVDLEGPDGKGSGLKFSMPSIGLPHIKTPDFDLSLKGPKLKGDHDIDLSSPNIEGGIKGPKVDIDVDVPEAEVEGGNGRFHLPKFKMPKFRMGGPKVEGPDLNIDANLPEADVNLSGPKIEGGIEMPDVDLDVEGPSGKIKGPKFKMPEFNISGPKIQKPDFDLKFKSPKVAGDVDAPDINLEGDMKGPNLNIKGPKVDLEGPDGKGSGLKFSMPSIGLPHIKTPDFDLSLKGPKLKGDHDIDLSSPNIEGGIKGPKVDIDVDVPEAEVEGGNGRFHLPKFKMPKFRMGGPKVEGPDLNIDANLPEADVNLSGPKIEGGIEMPDVDLDVEGPSGKIKGPKFKMPEFNISGPKIQKPDFDLEFKGPKVAGEVDAPDINLEGDMKGPNLNIKGPKIDLGGPDGKGSGLKFSMPSLHMPHIKAPDFDVSLKGPKLKGDHDVDLPAPNIQGEIKGPKVDIDVDVPEAEIEGGSGRFHLPKFKMPKFRMGGPKVEGPDLNIDAKVPEADVKVSGPKTEGVIEMPDVDVDVEGPSGKIKGPKFKMPEFNISGPKIQKPDFDLKFKGPKVAGDVDAPDINLEGDMKGPNLNIKGPKVDLERPDGKGSGLKFSMPSIGLPHIKAPDFDLNLKGPKLKGDHDIDLSSPSIEGGIKGPKVDIDVDVPEAEIEGGSGKFHLPKFKMPKFRMGEPKVEGPDLNIDAKVPEADVNLSGPKIEGGVEMPDVDVDVEGSSGKIKGPKFKMPEFNISGPKIQKPDFDLEFKGPKVAGDVDAPDINLEGDMKGPNLNIKGPKIDLGGPDAKGSGLKFSMPSLHMPHIKAPDFDVSLKGPKLKGDHDVDLPAPNIQGEVKGPKVDIDVDVPEAEIEGGSGRFHLPKFKMPKFRMGGPKVEGPDLNIDAKVPEADVKLSGPKIEGSVEMPDVDLDVEGPSGKIKGPKFKMPEFNISGPKIQKPDFDLEFKGPKVAGDVNAPDINLEGGMKGPNLNIKGPKVDLEGPDGKGSGLKFSMPSIGLPHIKAPDFDLNLKGPKLKGDHDIDLSSPSIEGGIKGPKVDIDVDVPEAEIEGGNGRFHLPKFKMPKFRMGGPKVEGPDLNIDANLPEADVNLSGPKIEGGIEMPDVDVDVEGPSGKIKGPKFKMPEFNISGPKIQKPDFDLEFKGPKLAGDVDAPDINLEGDMKGPNLNIKGPKIDLGGPDGKGSGLKFSMPSLHMPHIKAPDFDVSLKGPKLKGDHDVDLPAPNIQGEMKGPKVDIDVDVPEAEIEGGNGRFHLPKFKMPKFRMGGPKVEGPDLNIDANLPEADVNLSGPKIEGGIEMPDVDVDVEGPSGKIKGPKFKMPEFNISAPKIQKPDFDLEFKGPKLTGDVDAPNINLGEDIEGPNLNIKGPKVDIGGLDGKGSGLKFSMPSLQMPHIKAPDLDLSLKGPKLKGDHDFDVPSPSIEGEIKGPKVDINAAEADIKVPGGKFHLPKFKMPKFRMGGPKVEGPDLNVDANFPEADIKLSGPKIEGGLEMPDVDVDVEGPSGKIKGPKFKMPEFNISAPKIQKPDFDLEFKGPNVAGDVDVPDINLEGDMKGPNLNIKGPKVDIVGPDGKGSGLKFSKPSIHMPNIKAPDFDLSFKGPKLKGDQDIDVSSPNIEGEVKGPKVDVETPDVDLEGAHGQLRMPKIKMPKFRMGGQKVEGPDLNIDANLPEADINISGPKIKGGVEVPDVDMDTDGKIKGPGFQMPGFNISLPKVKAPNLDLGFKGPELTGGVGAPDINMKGDIKGPNFDLKGPKVDIEGPDMNIEGPDAKGNGHKFSLPSLGISAPNISSPDMNLDLKGQKLEGAADIKSPSFSIGVSAPEMDIDGQGAHLKMPKVKKPKFGFGIKGPQGDINAPSLDVTGPNVDLNVDSPDLNVSTKGKKGKFKMPKFNIKSKKPAGDVKVTVPKSDLDLSKPDVDIKSPDLNVSLGSSDGQLNIKPSKVKKPLFGKMKLSFPDVEFDLAPSKIKGELPSSKIEGDLQAPDVDFSSADIKGPHVDIRAPGIDVNTDVDLEGSGFKAKGTKLKFPSVNIKSPKMSEPDLDINLKGTNLKGEISGDVKGPTIDIKRPEIDFDVDAPNVDIEKPEGKFKMKMKKPKFNISGPKFKGSGVDIDVSTPKLESGIKGPEVNIDASSIDLQPKISAPDLHLKGSNLKSDVSVSGPTMECDIKGPNVNLDTSDVNIAGAEGKLKMPKLKLPSFGIDHKAAVPDMDVNLPKADFSGPKLEGDINIPTADIKIGAPDVNIDGHDAKVKGSNFEMPSWKISGPKISSPDFDLKGDIKGPKIDMKGPKLDLKAPDVSIEGPEGKLKMREFNISGPKLQGSDLNLGINAPKIVGDFKTPGLDVNVETPGVDINADGKFKGPQIALPSVGISAPNLDKDLKNPQLKGKVNISSPNVKGDFKGLDVDVKGPSIDGDAADFDIKGVGGKLKMPQINFPKADIDIAGQKIKGNNFSGFGGSAPDFGINVKGPKLEGNLAADLSGPKIDTDIKCPKVDITGPNVKMDSPDISFGGLKGRGPSVDFNAPKANIGFSEPKFEGDINVSAPDVNLGNLSAKVKGPEVKIPTADVKFDAKGPTIKGGVGVSSPKGDLKGPELDLKAPDIGADVKAAIADFDVPLDKLTIPKFKHSQFQIKGPNLEGPEMAVGVGVPDAQLISGAQGPSVNIKGPQASVNLPEGEVASSGIRIKKSKIKMPKLNFSKSKGKSSIEGSGGEFSASAPKIDIKGSKGSLGFSDIEIGGPEMSASGKGSGLDISTSPKGKSGTLDFSLFKGKKSERHRSSSLSDEHELSPSSPEGRIEFGEGAAGAKGKKSKLKFGTFGGFGAKSKGSYEVTLNEGEAAQVEGSGISLVSKKSRMSSSSSNESGSRAGFRLPKVELNINKNKA
ncbi:neuroblast differentiation-associated protein AHNAK [Heptranchias perlo]|uniref:neuroblast differentiation-associated protein AHNAK n=1 Tax=Heptranchias perlo TaxID=212740 RepID=UPI0035596316